MELLRYWRVIFILVLVGLALTHREDALQIIDTIRSAPPWLFFAALALVVIEFTLQAVRFKLVFERDWRETLRMYAVGHFAAFSFPSRALGEGARIAAFAKELGVGAGDAAAYVSVERLMDVTVILAAAALILVNVNPLLGAIVAVLVVIGFTFLESDSVYAKIMEKNLPRIAVEYIERGRRIVKRRRLFLTLFAITVVLWAIDFYRMWLVLEVMGGSIDYVTVASLVSIAYILAVLSFLPGGLGAYEGGLVGGLVLHGVPHDIAIAATLYERFFSYWFWIIVGALAGAKREKGRPRSESSSGA